MTAAPEHVDLAGEPFGLLPEPPGSVARRAARCLQDRVSHGAEPGAVVLTAHALTRLIPSPVQMVAEDGGWSAVLPGLPIAADGPTFAAAVDDCLVALREYAEDWNDHLLAAPNHVDYWGLVQLIELSSPEQLRAWLLGE